MGCSTIVVVQLILLIFPSIVVTRQDCNSGHGVSIDQFALLEFKKGIVSDPQNALGNWNGTIHVCKWNGVNCSKNSRRVSQLDLKGRSLQGTISPFLSNLSCLEFLELSDNSLHGPIPKDLGTLSSLQVLGLQGNTLQDEIPDSFGLLSNLHYIDLSKNQFRGLLPTSLLYNCTMLEYVDLSNNSFQGLIPPQVGTHLPYLANLLLYLNQLTGSIPASLSNASLLVELDFENNFLTGQLPSEIVMHMPKLTRLLLSYNNLLSAENNSNLTPFFRSISNLTCLNELELAGNKLGGELPSTVGLLHVNLKSIYLQENLIHGVIPPNITNLHNLTLLNLSSNLLSGTIPLQLILLPKLERLWLSNNLLHGAIPTPPSVVGTIGLLDISRNELSGAIPASLANLNRLRKLILNENLLSQAIPSSLGSLKLEVLDLSNNRLTGTIPAEVAGLSTMAFYFNMSNNFLSGTLPLELSKMDKVQAIDLSSNNFSGNIPSDLGSCKVVELLNLSHNYLQGPIPGSLGDLTNLQSLDLSLNSLSGEIPASLQNCTSLMQLNLSFNNFSGPLPKGHIFKSLTYESVEGNRYLCGSLPRLPSCSPKKRSAVHSRKFLVFLVSTVSILAFFLTCCCVVGSKLIRTSALRKNDGDSSQFYLDFLLSSHPRITHKELVEATGGFEQSRLIGSGSFGHVYRGVLSDGNLVAIKVLQLHTGNSTRSFNRECQVLKGIRHRNLMRIITACSLPDFKALVLPFMANGSLESHLYPQSQHSGSSNLSLIERVNICSDIAEGMAYLHHHSPVQVIHCDLKPSNILLNDDMTALVSDFGIARLIMAAGEGILTVKNTINSTTNLLCGSFGYVAPEYGFGRSASAEGDVFSFGIIVLEIITTKRPTDDMFNEGLSLHKWVENNYHGHLEKVVDSSLMKVLWDQSPEIKNMWEFAIVDMLELGLLCTQEMPSTRPAMIDAAGRLDRLKHYLYCDRTATSTTSYEKKSSTIKGENY